LFSFLRLKFDLTPNLVLISVEIQGDENSEYRTSFLININLKSIVLNRLLIFLIRNPNVLARNELYIHDGFAIEMPVLGSNLLKLPFFG